MNDLDNELLNIKKYLFDQEYIYDNDKLKVTPDTTDDYNIKNNIKNTLFENDNIEIYKTLDKSNKVSGLNKTNNKVNLYLGILEKQDKTEEIKKEIVLNANYTIKNEQKSRLDKINSLSVELVKQLISFDEKHARDMKYIKYAQPPCPIKTDVDGNSPVKKYIDSNGEQCEGLDWEGEGDASIVIDAIEGWIDQHIESSDEYSTEIKRELRIIKKEIQTLK